MAEHAQGSKDYSKCEEDRDPRPCIRGEVSAGKQEDAGRIGLIK